MPSRKHRDSYREIAHPINREMRQKLEQEILNAYQRESERNGFQGPFAQSA
jgi:DNA-binding cell septation regulator SpoVG